MTADFVWDHKGALAISAVLATFLADPRPFLDGATNLAGAVARPLAEGPSRDIATAARCVDWRIVAACVTALLAVVELLRRRRFPSP